MSLITCHSSLVTNIMKPIYLDYNATTPVDPEVARIMEPFMRELFGNPSSIHLYGTETRRAVEEARRQVARLIGAEPHEIVFTSGGTEANNLAIQGAARARRHLGNHIITTTIEHPAVSEVCGYLEKQGYRISRVPVDEFGMVNPDDVIREISKDTILISVMHANNEVGTIQPVAEIGRVAGERGILMHSDAAQSVGKIPVDVSELRVDLLSVAGHKVYAPKGIGVLYVRQGVQIEKIIHGADHEQDRRPGTENVLEIVGLGRACELVREGLPADTVQLKKMRDLLENLIINDLPESVVHGHPDERLPNTLSIGFPGIEANRLLASMPEIAASAGAACHAGCQSTSGVLAAMQVPDSIARGTVRLSTGRFTIEDEVRLAAARIVEAVRALQPDGDSALVNDEPVRVRLTQYTQAGGCACKMRPQDLEKVVKELTILKNPDILVGPETSDDAAVYRIDDETAIVETLDFFTPVVDDPYYFGAIAAANALSDIYAMGGTPLFALNIVAFPTHRLSLDVLREILRGAEDKTTEAGISILGGHTIEDTEPKFGLVATGRVHPDHFWTNCGARPGDAIILTKPLGTGVYSNAMKKGLLTEDQIERVCQQMATLNRAAANAIRPFEIHACTDVTGFGLMGHLLEMTRGAGVTAEIATSVLPFLPRVHELIEAGCIPGGTRNNLAYTTPWITWPDGLSDHLKLAICDAQTSGGLLVAIPGDQADAAMDNLRRNGVEEAALIGHMIAEGTGNIQVTE